MQKCPTCGNDPPELSTKEELATYIGQKLKTTRTTAERAKKNRRLVNRGSEDRSEWAVRRDVASQARAKKYERWVKWIEMQPDDSE